MRRFSWVLTIAVCSSSLLMAGLAGKDSTGPPGSVAQVRRLLSQGLRLTATDELLKLLILYPGERELTTLLGMLDEEARDPGRGPAGSLAERYYAEGYVAYFNGEEESALSPWKKFLEVTGEDAAWGPRKREVLRFLGEVSLRRYRRLGFAALRDHRFEEAVRSLGEASRMRPDDASLAGALGEAQRRRRLREGLAREVRERRELEELVDHGVFLFEKGDPEGARRVLVRACRMSPDHARARRTLALIEEFSKAKFDPEAAREYHKEALRARRLGQLSEARIFWRLCLRIDPGFQEAREGLERLEKELAASEEVLGRP